MRTRLPFLVLSPILLTACGESAPDRVAAVEAEAISLAACKRLIDDGFREVAESRERRFLGKVGEDAAACRGGERALAYRDRPWIDWANYWGAGDSTSVAPDFVKRFNHLSPTGRGIDGALIDLEYARIELIKFNLFDNYTYTDYVRGREGTSGPALKVWPQMRLDQNDPNFAAVGGAGTQVCSGELIRFRTTLGICNDIFNPRMGSTGTVFARNVPFESTFPDLGMDELARNRHGDRLGLMQPDPQVISRVLLSRQQSNPEACNQGLGLPDQAANAQCDYKPASFFNVLAAFWIQFMTHDWFSHLNEGHNDRTRPMMEVGCRNKDATTPLTPEEIEQLGCRPDDRAEPAIFAATGQMGTVTDAQGNARLAQAPSTFSNNVTAWWDASQLYGYDDVSQRRVKRDPRDAAKLELVTVDGRSSAGDRIGYLPVMQGCGSAGSPCTNGVWEGQEAAAFPDNFSIGMSFYHNVFAREHNVFVDKFREQARRTPEADSGLRNPANPKQPILYRDVTDEELFQVARLVIAAEIAKIHTIEWTTQLLYNEPLYRGMNGNWGGLFEESEVLQRVTEKILDRLRPSEKVDKTNQWYSVLAAGPGIVGLGSRRYEGKDVFTPHFDRGFIENIRRGNFAEAIFGRGDDIWDLSNPEHVNGGVNHFGSPFNFPEEFITVYRLHPLVPDLLEFRELGNDPNQIRAKVPVVSTFRGLSSQAMRSRGLENWALTMGRQRLGVLALQNHPQFLQNLPMTHLGSPTQTLDIVALDIIRDREHGIPRFNEFRRQYGLQQLTSFDDFIDHRLPEGSDERREQERLAGLLRQVYGQHVCDNSKVITDAQVNLEDGSPITDCLGHPDGSIVDNVEDIDTVVGWLAETTRPHGYAISETQFVVFILNASRRLFSDRFFTSSFRPEFYSNFGYEWVMNNGPDGTVIEKGQPNGHTQPVSPMKRVLLRVMPELEPELRHVVNVFDPWARDRGDYYSLDWKPRPDAKSDPAFGGATN